MIQLNLEYAPAPPFDAGRPETAPAAILEQVNSRRGDALRGPGRSLGPRRSPGPFMRLRPSRRDLAMGRRPAEQQAQGEPEAGASRDHRSIYDTPPGRSPRPDLHPRVDPAIKHLS